MAWYLTVNALQKEVEQQSYYKQKVSKKDMPIEDYNSQTKDELDRCLVLDGSFFGASLGYYVIG